MNNKKGWTLPELLVVIVMIVIAVMAVYSSFMFDPEITCIKGYQYEEDYDGDFEPITDWMGRKILCERRDDR